MTEINFKSDYNKETIRMNNFAKEITLDDVLSCFDEQTLDKYQGKITLMFNEIAGSDQILQGTELETFMNEVDIKYAGKDNILTGSEAQNIAKDYGRDFDPLARLGGLWLKLISILCKVNADNLTKEAEEAKQTTTSTNTTEKADGSKAVVENKADKSTVESRYDKKGTLTRQITKNPQGEITEDVEFHKNGTVTYHTYFKHDKEYKDKDLKEATKTVDKDGNTIKTGEIYLDGTKKEYYMKNNVPTQIVTKYKDGNKRIEHLDNLGRVSDAEFFTDDDHKINTHYEYYDDTNIQRSKSERHDSGYKVFTLYDKDGNATSETETSSNGSSNKTLYGKNNQATKRIAYDKDGNITSTTEYTYDSEYADDASKEVEKDASGNTIRTTTRKFDKNGLVTQVTTTDDLGEQVIEDYDKNGNKTWETRDDGFSLIEKTKYTKNGEETTITTKEGKLLKTIIKNNEPYRLIVKNAKDEIIETEEKIDNTIITKSGEGIITKTYTNMTNGYEKVYYKEGKPYCTKTLFKENDGYTAKYTDGNGNEIDWNTYYKLYDEINLVVFEENR